jgi:alpha-tubulin suppressor-like RCC1 family protein
LNQFGQLGTGTQVSELAPTNKVGASPATDWLAVATGGSHTVALKKDSTLYTWGSNSQGQLAVGEAPGGYKLVPTQEIGKSKSWKAVAAGALHTIALQSSGVVARWGVNNRGQLGFPPATVLPAGFTPIFFDSVPYVSIAAGGDHTLAIRASDTTLWAWGANGFGQLGTGADGDGYAARQVFISDPEKSNTDWQMVAAGGGHNPVGADNSANGGHSVAIKKDGTLWAWGSNAYGQLGTGLSSDEPTPVQILVPKGTGRDDDWVMVSAGKLHTFARKKDGTLWGWGDNRSGQLGVGDTIQKPIVPTRIR